jgi:CheY-like chemotaxis protein
VGFTDLLKETTLDKDQKEYVDIVDRSSEAMIHLVDDVLQMSTIESGELSISTSSFDLHDLLDTFFPAIKSGEKEKDVRYNQNISVGVPRFVVSDRDKIRQILVNLVGNAMKFTERGFVLLEVSYVKSEMGTLAEKVNDPKNGSVISPSIDNNPESGYLIIHVIDSGIGIPAKKMNDIFLPFNQVDSSITRKYGGSGLGLAITRKLVESLSGSIRVYNNQPRGTKFTIQIPVTVSNAVEAKSDDPILKTEISFKNESGADPGGIRILVVEDVEDNRNLVERYLGEAGYEYELAKNGKEAVEKFIQNSYDLILMDLQMPVMDGNEAAQYIRSYEKNLILSGNTKASPVVIVALSAHAIDEEFDRAIQSGCDFYLTKPIRKKQLLERIREICALRNSDADNRSNGINGALKR